MEGIHIVGVKKNCEKRDFQLFEEVPFQNVILSLSNEIDDSKCLQKNEFAVFISRLKEEGTSSIDPSENEKKIYGSLPMWIFGLVIFRIFYHKR